MIATDLPVLESRRVDTTPRRCDPLVPPLRKLESDVVHTTSALASCIDHAGGRELAGAMLHQLWAMNDPTKNVKTKIDQAATKAKASVDKAGTTLHQAAGHAAQTLHDAVTKVGEKAHSVATKVDDKLHAAATKLADTAKREGAKIKDAATPTPKKEG